MRRMILSASRRLAVAAVVLFGVCAAHAADIAGFDDLTLLTESQWNGSDESGGFISGDYWFNNAYDTTYSSWDGFAYSNRTDTSTSGMPGQYTAYSGNDTGGGVGGSDNYGIGYVGWALPPQVYAGYMTGEYAQNVQGAYFTNNAYAYHSMVNGDAYAKQFGGTSGDDADWFLLTIKGLDANYEATANSVEFYLADYRFTDNGQDYIVSDWTYVDLTSLGTVYGLEFTLSSSDVSGSYMNTPAYFAIDNLEFSAVPEPGTIVLLLTALAVCFVRPRNRNRVN